MVFYVFRTLVGVPIPATAGGMRPLEIIAPEGTVVNALPPAAVCGGNVETSQRIVDVLYRCLARAMPDTIPAASQGTMNNITFGGTDHRTGSAFAYYETIAGGMGARPTMDGISGVHTHMTNSMNTPVEAIEYAYPVRIERYGLRPASGGDGRYRGGDGIVRSAIDRNVRASVDERVCNTEADSPTPARNQNSLVSEIHVVSCDGQSKSGRIRATPSRMSSSP